MSRAPVSKLNLLDRAISFLDPVRGARRMHARGMMALAGGYLGGRRDRPGTKNWRLTNNSPDQDILGDLALLRDRSRDLVRNAPLATGAVGTVVQNTVGGGLALQSKPDWELLGMTADQAGEWSAEVEREFMLFAETPECDLTRTQNFYGLQELAFRSALESGDVIVLLPMLARPRSVYDLKLQIIEADRLESPRGTREGQRLENGTMIAGGVELDAQGAPLAYHILQGHPGDPNGRALGSDRILAWGDQSGRRNVIHVFDRTRPGQHRGVPYLSPVIELLKQLDRYTEAEVMASVLSALITIFVKSESEEGMTSTAGASQTAAEKKQEIQLGSGGIIDLGPNEDIASFAPNRPNQSFDAFMLAVLRQIGTGLGLPFEVLIKHFTASYSASRAAMLEAWRFFRGRREFLANQFCRPVFEAWMEEAVARGRVDAPGFFDRPELRQAYLLSEWRGDAMSQIDPVKEVDAAAKRIELEVSTLEDETLQLTGKQWADVHRQRIKEKRMQRRDGTATPLAAAPAGGAGENMAPPAPPPDQQETGDLETQPPDQGAARVEATA